MSMTSSQRKKLIEVALPLESINEESSRRKRKAPAGYPTTLHKWWAQRPLAACRAVIFASLVDDPGSRPDLFPTESAQEQERQRLFKIIEEMIKWENSNNELVLGATREEIIKATGGNPPVIFDPFSGGGSIPLEAQRLGLKVHGNDLNPIAVLITRALVEIPPLFSGHPPVNPESRKKLSHSGGWKGVLGLAEDVRYYGSWIRDEAERRIGHLYPKVRLPNGKTSTVVAWLWARTVKCPNPACGAIAPLIRSFWLTTKKGKEAWLEPVVVSATKDLSFRVRHDAPDVDSRRLISMGSSYLDDRGKKVKATFRCLICKSSIIKGDYIDEEANGSRMGVLPLAIVAEGSEGRTYVGFEDAHIKTALEKSIESLAVVNIQERLPRQPARGTFASNAQGRIYGFKVFSDYFTARQLIALTTISELIEEAATHIKDHASASGSPNGEPLREGGSGAIAYADAVRTYLSFAVSRAVDYNSAISTWRPKDNAMRAALSMQAIPMVWDFAEANPLASSSAGFLDCCKVIAKCLEYLPASSTGTVIQQDAHNLTANSPNVIFCTDPPYYSNVSYADLADYFYVWLRENLHNVFPDVLSTLLTPKAEELVASPYRFDGDAERAQSFFQEGLEQAFKRMRQYQNSEYPVTVFYAFKQTESDDESDEEVNTTSAAVSTGWETMLEGLIRSGFTITGTWPMRTEGDNRQVGIGANALASSIVLVCRPRPEGASLATRRDFLNALKRELPDALKKLQHGNIAPVDLAQAAIGPGMAVFSRYSKVIESGGSPMRVRTALQLINQSLDEVLAEQESEYDAETRWAVAWFEQFGMNEGLYGTAETLSKAKNTSVSGMDEAGVTTSRAGKVRLLRRDELPEDWSPTEDARITAWEVTQHLIHALDTGGEQAAAALLAQVGGMGDVARDLAYRLYTTSERKGWTQEALAYNSLVVAWPEISRLATAQPAQTSGTLF